MLNEVERRHEGSEICERGSIMDIAAAKSALREHARGKKLNQAAIGELCLAGYIAIDLQSLGKKLLPTVVTEKGKQLLAACKAPRSAMPFLSCFFPPKTLPAALLGCSGRKYKSLSSLT